MRLVQFWEGQKIHNLVVGPPQWIQHLQLRPAKTVDVRRKTGLTWPLLHLRANRFFNLENPFTSLIVCKGWKSIESSLSLEALFCWSLEKNWISVLNSLDWPFMESYSWLCVTSRQRRKQFVYQACLSWRRYIAFFIESHYHNLFECSRRAAFPKGLKNARKCTLLRPRGLSAVGCAALCTCFPEFAASRCAEH